MLQRSFRYSDASVWAALCGRNQLPNSSFPMQFPYRLPGCKGRSTLPMHPSITAETAKVNLSFQLVPCSMLYFAEQSTGHCVPLTCSSRANLQVFPCRGRPLSASCSAPKSGQLIRKFLPLPCQKFTNFVTGFLRSTAPRTLPLPTVKIARTGARYIDLPWRSIVTISGNNTAQGSYPWPLIILRSAQNDYADPAGLAAVLFFLHFFCCFLSSDGWS